MRNLLVTFCLSCLFASGSAFASRDLICEEDLTPADGYYSKVEVKFQDAEMAGIFLTRVNPENSEDRVVDKQIGENLKCKYETDGVFLACNDDAFQQQVRFVVTGSYLEVQMPDRTSVTFKRSSCKRD